jgi:hypothetical protein
MTAVLAAFSLQDEIERYGAYAGIAAVFGLGILSLLYFAQAREVKRLREWAGRAPERAAELEARVTADAQRRVAPAPQPTPRPTAPAAQQGAAPATPGIAAPATAAAAAGAPGSPASTVAKPGTTAPQNGTGSGAAVPAPGTEAKDGESKDGEGKDGETAKNGAAKEGDAKEGEAKEAEAKEAEAKEAEAKNGEAKEAEKPGEAVAASAAGEPKPFGPQPKPAEPEANPPVPAATAAAAAAASPGPAVGAPATAGTASSPAPRPAPLRAPTPSASLPPRTPAGARWRTGADDGRSRGRIAAIVGAAVGVLAVLVVAGILIFGGGDDNPAPKPNTVAQPAADSTAGASGAATPSKAPAKVDRKAVPLAVLNGTTVTGLARGAADKLTAKGYNEPNVVTNDTTNQARPTTQIFYEAKARAAALDVAKVLGVATSQVKPMDANARALADRAEVAVFVGADKAQ